MPDKFFIDVKEKDDYGDVGVHWTLFYDYMLNRCFYTYDDDVLDCEGENFGWCAVKTSGVEQFSSDPVHKGLLYIEENGQRRYFDKKTLKEVKEI